MLTLQDTHNYQRQAINFLIAHPRAMLWLFLGAGKTMVSLTVISHLIRHGVIRAAMVFGPLRVVQSAWEREAAKWEHLQHLRFGRILGTAQQRMAGLQADADIYLCNYDNLKWLSLQLQHYFIQQGTLLPFDYLTLDEITRMKNYETERMRAMLPLLPYFTWRSGLTGTPVSRGYYDLFGQYLCLDNGERLGTSTQIYTDNWFEQVGYGGYSYQPTEAGKRAIEGRIADITLDMPQDEYLKLPELIVDDIYVELSPRHRRQYDALERDFFTDLDNGAEVLVAHEAGKVNKLLQFANGAVYTDTETKTWEKVHDEKLNALESIVEEAGGEPILLAYAYRTDALRIMQRFPFARNLTDMTDGQFNQALDDWGEGKLRLLIGHPGSMGHGVDGLQVRGNIAVWYGLNHSLELTQQLNGRLHRQGQGRPVRCYRIMARDTWDEIQRDNLSGHYQDQKTLREAVGAYRERRGL